MTNGKTAVFFTFAMYALFNIFFVQKHLYFTLPSMIQVLHFCGSLRAEIRTNRAKKAGWEKQKAETTAKAKAKKLGPAERLGAT